MFGKLRLQSGWALVTLATTAAALLPTAPSGAQAPWQQGDVFLAVGDGSYHVFDRTGRFKEAIEDDFGGYTSDCGFSPSLDRLYTVNYTHTKVVVYGDDRQHAVVQTIDAAEASPNGHSGAIAFGADGSFFVGHPDGNSLIHRYDAGGSLTETFEVDTEGRRGTNWIDLSADQQTLFYTSAGRSIQRFDTASRAQLGDYAELPGDGHAEALRLLAPGDGSGGLLVADGVDIKRLDEMGEVIGRYDAPGRDSWFAINLDPDGQTFWATDHESDRVYRFNMDTATTLSTFAAGPGNSVFGVCLKGELTAGVSHAGGGTPQAYAVEQNAPNPFNPTTSITYRLPVEGRVSLVVYNLVGQKVQTLVDEQRAAGTHTSRWDGRDGAGRDVSSGVYFYRFVAEGLIQTRPMVLLK